ncbi:hypothetical protein NQ156_08020 [Microbacterium sp. zg.Y625]|nr:MULTISPECIES: hypothetical protein [unclassified Microbacterium]MCR2793003.1 hypothetical protein [Microbacterium sp. zg.Y625]WIM24118.1 hypothetical protein QNO14_08045 [Microbacterium sp. zg-Y625]
MDRASLWTAHGMSLAFAGIRSSDEAELSDSVPANGEHMIADDAGGRV